MTKENEQIDILKDELRKTKKYLIGTKEKETKNELKMKEMTKSSIDVEDQFKRDIENLRISNKRLKIEAE